MFFSLRCAGQLIEFAKDQNAIAIGELKVLQAVLDTWIEVTRTGELVEQFTAATMDRRYLFQHAS